MLRHFHARFALVMAVGLLAPVQVPAQILQKSGNRLATVIGTVVDVNGGTIAGATVLLKDLDGDKDRKLVTSENGFFSFQDVDAGIPYQVIVSAKRKGSAYSAISRIFTCLMTKTPKPLPRK